MTSTNTTSISVYTDGSKNNLRKTEGGGWAYVVAHPHLQEQLGRDCSVVYGHVPAPTTNNRMELKAVLEAVRKLRTSTFLVTVYSDSEYVVKGLNHYIQNWICKNFVGVKNDDLWRELWRLLESKRHKFTFEWVRGHNGNTYNEIADAAANKGRLQQ